MKSLVRAALLSAVFLTPLFAGAATVSGNDPYVQNTNTSYSFGFVSTSGGLSTTGSCAGYGLSCIGTTIISIINDILVPVLFAIAFVVFLYGIAETYIFSRGEPEEVAKGHKIILWGIIGFVVMVSLWGMVNVVSNTFGLSGASTPTLPRTKN